MPDTQSTGTPPHLAVGRWVLCWGQIIARPSHPEDSVVEFFSHNEQYHAHIRQDRIQAASTPDFAIQCHALKSVKANKYLRCTETEGHAGAHRSGSTSWPKAETSGHIEDDC